MMLAATWAFRRNGILPVLNVVGGCYERGEEVEAILKHSAVKFIYKAKKFNGRPYENENNISNEFNTQVSFSLIFPSENDIDEYMENLKK